MRLASVTEALGLLEKAAKHMYENSMLYYRFSDMSEIRKIFANKTQPEVRSWLEETGFELRENKNSCGITLDIFIPRK